MVGSWTHVSHRVSLIAVAMAAVMLALPTKTAQAQSQSQSQSHFPFATRCYARAVWVTANEVTGGSVQIDTFPRQSVTIKLQPGVTVKTAKYSYKGFLFQQTGSEIEVIPRPGLPANRIAETTIHTNKFPIQVKLRVAEDPNKTTSLVYVTEQTRRQFCQQELKEPIARLNEDVATQRVRAENAEARAKHAAGMSQAWYKLYEHRRRYPVPDANLQTTGPVTAHLLEAELLAQGRGTLVVLELVNSMYEDIALARLVASNATAENEPIDVIVVDAPPPKDERLLAVIPASTRVRAVLKLPAALGNELKPMSIELQGLNGIGSFVAAAESWRLRPVDDEEYKREQRAKQSSLSVHMITGGIWLADSTGLDELEGTYLVGFGARYQKGFASGLAVEIEAAGGRTGQVRFNDASLDDMSGNLEREAFIGRVLLSGAIRFGDPYVTTLRIGLGVQGGSYRSRLVATDGGTELASDSSLELEGIVSFGGGLQARIGESLFAGLDANVVWVANSLSDERQGSGGIQIGINVGYGWLPSKKEPDSSH